MGVYKDEIRKTWYFRKYILDSYGDKKQITRSGFKTKSEAKREEDNFKLPLPIEEKENHNNLTFKELCDDYLLAKKQSLKSQSYRATISKLSNHILPYFGKYKVKDIDHRIYIAWKNEILKLSFSDKYNTALHGSMVSILKFAIDFYDLNQNIASKVGNFKKTNYIIKHDIWSYDEYQRFISVVDDFVFKKFYRTLYFTGMRQGEALALNWNDFIGDYLKVEKTIAKCKNNGLDIITTPKTKSSIRKIQLDITTKEELEKLKNYYKSDIDFTNNWFIFGGLHSLSTTTIGRKKDEYCIKAKVKRIKIHDFRHSHASLLISRGTPITVISNRLGHSNTATTLGIYSHMIQEDENKAISILNNL